MRPVSAWREVPVPQKLRKRPKDRRGYPVPYTALLDKNRQPHFDVIDEARKKDVATKGKCQLCGDKLDRGPEGGAWLIGGPICFWHETGAFLDPPMHKECAQYALRVCPYLALPSYNKLLDGKRLTDDNRPDEFVVVTADTLEGRPGVFLLGQAASYVVFPMGGGSAIRNPGQNWLQLEAWVAGEIITDQTEIKRLLDLDMARHTA